MNPAYDTPEESPNRQRQGTSKQQGFLEVVKLPSESTFKRIINQASLSIKTTSQRCQQIVKGFKIMHHHQS